MSSRLFTKAMRGDQLRMSADEWNAVKDAALANRESSFNQDADADEYSRSLVRGLVRNNSGADWPQFAAVALRVPIILPTDNVSEFKSQHTFEGYTAEAEDTAEIPQRIGVTLEPIADGSIGEVAVAGVVQCHVLMADDAHRFGTLVDDAIYLDSATSGSVVIEWAEAATAAVNISFVTTEENPVITTATAHGLVAGDMVSIAAVGGATEITGPQTVLEVVDETMFTITADEPSAYTSGGTVTRVSWAKVRLGAAASATTLATSCDTLYISTDHPYGSFVDGAPYVEMIEGYPTHVVEWDGSLLLTDGFWDEDEPTRIMIPETGFYLIDSQFSFFDVPSSGGTVSILLRLIDSDGVTRRANRYNVLPLTFWDAQTPKLSYVGHFNAGDYFRIHMVSRACALHYGKLSRPAGTGFTGIVFYPGTYLDIVSLSSAAISGIIGTDTIDGGTWS